MRRAGAMCRAGAPEDATTAGLVVWMMIRVLLLLVL
jgi:hypothetical protein